jgi:putative oxidoreductase
MNAINQMLPRMARKHDLLVGGANHLQSAVLLGLRLTWGWQLVESGYGHLTHVQRTVEAFKGWGVPLPELNVYISGGTELVGGALLVLGLATRLISMPLIFNFLVAYATASRDKIKQLFLGPDRLDGYDKFINDSAFTMLVLALVMLAFGPGKASLDYFLRRKLGSCPLANASSPETHLVEIR